MGEIVSMDRRPVYWTIDIEPGQPDFLDIREKDDFILVFIAVDSFDRIDELRKRATALLYRRV